MVVNTKDHHTILQYRPHVQKFLANGSAEMWFNLDAHRATVIYVRTHLQLSLSSSDSCNS